MPQVEESILSRADELIAGCPSGVEGMDEALARVESNIHGTETLIDGVVHALSASPNSTALAARLSSLEAGLLDEQADRAVIVDRIAVASSPVLARRLSDLKASLIAKKVNRAEVNARLRVLLRSIEIDHVHGQLVFNWKHGGESSLMYAWPRG